MSSFVEISPLSSQVNTYNNYSLSSKPYNDLITYGSIRKQFIRIIPQYTSLENKKIFSKNKFSSNIEELNKYKQEILSLKESISILKEKKQKKLEQIEELRCLMRKVGNNNENNNNNNFHINNYHKERETKDQRNNDQRFRGNSSIDKKQRFAANSTTTSNDNEGGLSLLPSSSGLSSGKDDDTAPESGIYQDRDNQEDFILSLSNSSSNSNSNCCCNNNCGWRCCFGVEKDKASELKGMHEKDCALLEKEN